MAEHEHPSTPNPEGSDGHAVDARTADAHGAEATRRTSASPARGLLGIAAVLPLAAAVAGLVMVPSARPQQLPAPSAQAQVGPRAYACPGPLELPDDALAAGPDAKLSLTPPSQDARIRSVALEADSSLLFGSVNASETQRDQQTGDVLAPRLTASGPDGERIAAQPQAKDLGAAVLSLGPVHRGVDVEVAPGGKKPPVADTVQVTSTPSGDFRSAAATRCSAPATTATFLGASTQVGDSSALVLRNTSARPATASVQAWGEKGAIAMKGRSRVVVPAGEEKRVLLESIAPGEAALGVRVDVLGAPLVMDLQTTSRDGLTPNGADVQSPLEPAGERLVIPAVRSHGAVPELILLNPGRTDAKVSAGVYGTGGTVKTDELDSIDLPAGQLVRVPVKGLPAGEFTVELFADQPISAVARSRVPGRAQPGSAIGAPSDQVIDTAAPALNGGTVLAIPEPSALSRLVLVADESTSATVIPIQSDGSAREPVTIKLRAGTTYLRTIAQLKADANTTGLAIIPESDGLVHGAWLHSQDDGAGGRLISSLTVVNPPATGAELSVRTTG